MIRDIQIAPVARRLGLEVSANGRQMSPCPRCGETRRGRRDKRWPVNIHSGGCEWHCHHCKEGGGAQSLGMIEPSDVISTSYEPDPYMTPAEVRAAWESCEPLPTRVLEERGIAAGHLAKEGIARGRIRLRAPWLGRVLPVTIPAWDIFGTPKGLVLRDPKQGGAGYFPVGKRREGLWMANAEALAVMVHRETPRIGVIVEGATDFLWACSVAKGLPVWGGTSGAFRFARSEWAQHLLVCTDADAAGDRYAKEAAKAAGGVYRFSGDLLDNKVMLADAWEQAIWLAA